MGIKVVSYDGQQLILSAPLENNINHQGSGFGGSLFSVAALSGWGLLQMKMSELEIVANTVIAGGEVGYSAPVYADFTCQCSIPAEDEWKAFLDKLRSAKKASIKLKPEIHCQNRVCMGFEGNYVLAL